MINLFNVFLDYEEAWEKQFEKVEQLSNNQSNINNVDNDDDALAQTAKEILRNVKPETNSKFSNSQFFNLMKSIADHSVKLRNDEFVDANNEQQQNSQLQSNKGKEREVIENNMYNKHSPSLVNAPSPYNKLFGMFDSSTPVEGEIKANEQVIDGSLEKGNGTAEGVRGLQEAEWEKLQSDWQEQVEPTTSQIKMNNMSNRNYSEYKFMNDNQLSKYTISPKKSLEEAEREVKANPRDAKSWYELGVTQQENEKEVQAIAALSKAIELDPTLSEAYLGLSISFTNESDKLAAVNAIKNWIKYKYNNDYDLNKQNDNGDVIETLCNIVKNDAMVNIIDADVQVALGVMFSLNEEYDKGIDCFHTALTVKPHDWLLLNRLGATLANSGQSHSSLEFYYRALEYHPSYVRAKFNLGIALMNLRVCLYFYFCLIFSKISVTGI